MKIKFIGVGSAFTSQQYYQSNMLITSRSGKKLLIDCGSDARFSLKESGVRQEDLNDTIDGVYISHLHADHIGGMEWLSLCTYFGSDGKRPSLFMEREHMKDMWNNSLKGGLERVNKKIMHLTDYFLCHPLDPNDSFVWENIHFKLYKMPHIKTNYHDHDSFGLLIEENGNTCFISTDTQFKADLLTQISGKTDLIFHDCETSSFPTTVHAHYDELFTISLDIKKKIWLYHYQPTDINPQKDGFKGFVIKGQEFDIS